MAKINIKLVKSPIGYNKSQRATLTALGLRKLHQVKEVEYTPSIRGMVQKVQHLVELSEGPNS